MNQPSEGVATSRELPNRIVKTSGGPTKPITMAGIAKAAGVSQGAISSLLNDRDYGIRVSDKTRERVFKVCREMGYVPNDLRAVVRMYPELGDLCLLVSSHIAGALADPFVARVAGGAMSAISQGSLVVSFYDEGREYSNDDLPVPIQNGTASKVLWVGPANVSLSRILLRRGIPMAVVGYESRELGTLSVAPDYVAAARLAFRHFVQHGHKNITIVSGPFGSPEPRLTELNRALGLAAHEVGIKIESHGVYHSDLSFEAGRSALDTLLERNPATTAVFALSEAAACGLMARAHSLGMAIPERLSVLALSESDHAPASCIPLTTVNIPVDQLAVAAIRELESHVRQSLPFESRRLLVGAILAERASVGARA